MECLEPGAIRPEELLAYLAGERVSPVVEQHLAHCQYCSAQLADYRRIEHTLTHKLYRWDCPPNHVLGEYQLGLLSPELTAAVNNHLNICTLCTAEVTSLIDFLEAEPLLVPVAQVAVLPHSASRNNNHRSAPRVKEVIGQVRRQSAEGLRRIVATLLPPQPRLAYQRGETAAAALWPRQYSAENVSISVQLERNSSSRDTLQLIGFVIRKGDVLEALRGIPVQLSAQTNTVYTQHIDELGNFVFPSVAPATYTLELQFPESVVVIEHLPISLQD
ncbi:MAG: hypothetical protein M3Z24_16580 [Chloroflexota bacterium]|nr:hypothetical protein [Chloroflexota bacterium]